MPSGLSCFPCPTLPRSIGPSTAGTRSRGRCGSRARSPKRGMAWRSGCAHWPREDRLSGCRRLVARIAGRTPSRPAHRADPHLVGGQPTPAGDSTAAHAHKIAEMLANPTGHGLEGRSAEDVAAVAARLRRLSSDPEAAPLEVIRLRGGIEWRRPTDPSRPAVLLSTLPMYGSRLLFRGYGSSRGMRPIDAALAGIDSLVLLDEAHLAPHLRTVISALAQCGPGARTILGEARCHPRLVELTATGDAAAGARFDLDADDEAHQIVRERLDAAKPTELRTFDTADLGRHLAEAARDLVRDASDPAACVVFANTPKTARSAFDRLRRLIPGDSADLILLTGRSREHDAEAIRTRILDPGQGMAASRDPAVRRERHLIVIATQTLEVGADVDGGVPRQRGVRGEGADAATRQAESTGTSRPSACDLHPRRAQDEGQETRGRRRVAGVRPGTEGCSRPHHGCPERPESGDAESFPAADRRHSGTATRRLRAGAPRSCPGSCGNGSRPRPLPETRRRSNRTFPALPAPNTP